MATSAKWTDFSSLDGASVAALATNRLPAILSLIFVVLLGWQCARIVWLLMPGSTAGDTVSAVQPSGARPAPTRGGMPNVEAIAQAHLFGEAKAEDDEPAPPPEPTENLQDTRLALTLKGTMAGNDDEYTRAMIEDNRNEVKVYSVGDSVTSGTTLHSVFPDRVVLNRNGVLEALRLPKDLPTSSAPVRSRPVATRTAQAPVEDNSGGGLQEAITQNAAKLADVIRPTPYFVGGQQQGYRVYPGRDRRQFAALGLRPGDLIKDIDGQSLSDPQQAMQIFQNLGTADQVSVTVERNGQPEVLVLTTDQLQSGNDSE